MRHLAKDSVEICANCGKLSRSGKEEFLCPACGCDVCVVLPRRMFLQMVEQGLAKQ